jgi:hypothetical protein
MPAGELPFFRSAAEDQRIAAFQTSDGFTLAGELQNEIEDTALYTFLLAFVFANVDQFGARVGEAEQFGIYQPIVEDDVAFAEQTHGFECQQLWVSGTGTDQVQLAQVQSTELTVSNV